MCFLPKSLASMDQAPGPIIANVAPRMPRVMEMSGLVDRVKMFHASSTAIRVPASGVHKPNNISSPVAAPMIAGATAADLDVCSKTIAAQ